MRSLCRGLRAFAPALVLLVARPATAGIDLDLRIPLGARIGGGGAGFETGVVGDLLWSSRDAEGGSPRGPLPRFALGPCLALRTIAFGDVRGEAAVEALRIGTGGGPLAFGGAVGIGRQWHGSGALDDYALGLLTFGVRTPGRPYAWASGFYLRVARSLQHDGREIGVGIELGGGLLGAFLHALAAGDHG
jgi:hypothetical protein